MKTGLRTVALAMRAMLQTTGAAACGVGTSGTLPGNSYEIAGPATGGTLGAQPRAYAHEGEMMQGQYPRVTMHNAVEGAVTVRDVDARPACGGILRAGTRQ